MVKDVEEVAVVLQVLVQFGQVFGRRGLEPFLLELAHICDQLVQVFIRLKGREATDKFRDQIFHFWGLLLGAVKNHQIFKLPEKYM